MRILSAIWWAAILRWNQREFVADLWAASRRAALLNAAMKFEEQLRHERIADDAYLERMDIVEELRHMAESPE